MCCLFFAASLHIIIRLLLLLYGSFPFCKFIGPTVYLDTIAVIVSYLLYVVFDERLAVSMIVIECFNMIAN